PDIRRRFMDDLIVQMRPALGDARRDFDRVLRQRNALLKSGRKPGAWTPEHESTLAVWNEHLSKAAARLINGRLHALRSEEHTSELQSRFDIVCRLLLDKK